MAAASVASGIRPWPEELTGFVGVVVFDCQEPDTDPTMQGIDLQSLEAKFASPNEAKEISSYVNHINTYLCEDPFLKNYLPMDPTGNQLFDLIRDGVLLCKLINLAAPGTIDERDINKKTRLNLWQRNENHTRCLKSAEAIGCTVVNIDPQDLLEGRPHLVLGLLSQIIKIHLQKTQQHEKMDTDKSDSSEEMENGDSQKFVCSSDGMTEDGDLPEDSGDEDMGDADSDDIYLEGFRSPDEMESEDDEEELDDDEKESDDDERKFDYYEFEADYYNQSLEAPDKKAGGAEEKRPQEKHTTTEIVDVLDDGYELQVECGLLTRWALLNYSSLSYKSSRRFLVKLRDTCLSLGMAKFSPLPMREFRETVDPDALEKLLDALKIELVLLIPPSLEYNDEEIGEMCEKLGIAYQSCYPLQWEGSLKSLARQIQYKVVKHLVRLHRLELPLVREAPTIIFGADMVRGEGFESIASVVASVDWPKFRKYLGVVSYQEYNTGFIKNLDASPDGMMAPFLKSFLKKNKELPERLIFFRNGLEKGEISHICDQEISAIRQACTSFHGSLTYVVVMMHLDEIVPGSIMCKYKYFCRHTTKEISTVACYFVVHDENDFPAGELQALTSQLCTFRHRQKNPRMDVVIPAYLAFQNAVDELRDED